MNKSSRVLSSFTRFISLSSLFLIASFLSTYQGISQTVRVSLPLDRTVFQQSVINDATFQLAGQVKNYLPSSNVAPEYQVESLDKNGLNPSIKQAWTANGVNYSNTTGFFNKTITLTTGWYRITVRYSGNNNAIKVGVGEVIFAAGQSNAQGVELQNFGGIPNLGVNYDCISAINESGWCLRNYKFPFFERMTYSANDKVSLIAPHGNQTLWCYQALGKRIVDKNSSVVTPVLVFNAASVATSVENWSISAGNENAITYPPLFPLNDDGTPTQCCQTNRFDWGPNARPEGQP